MDRFVAFAWDSKDLAAQQRVYRWRDALRARAHHWNAAITAADLCVMVRTAASGKPSMTPMSNATGLVVGKIFERGKGQQGAVTNLSWSRLNPSLRDGSAEALSPYWGSFVAIVRDQPSGDLHVVRDPCG